MCEQVPLIKQQESRASFAGRAEATEPVCVHCGAPCPDDRFSTGGRAFCCNGCRAVFELLEANGLTHFYELAGPSGVRPSSERFEARYAFLNEPEMRDRLLSFSDGRLARVTFRLPAIHCAACVWLLENLYRLHPGVGASEVDFTRREATITFSEEALPLGELAALLAGLGYEPEIDPAQLEAPQAERSDRRLLLQLGVAGFVFGNVMLMSLPSYFGLDRFSGPSFQRFFGWLSLGLSLPALLYSASDYWRAAWLGLRRRLFTIDFPIALGLAALYAQSVHDVLSGAGTGYLDSFAGLIFFLLCGRWFQRRTYDHLSFERDYRSYFPLSVTRRREGLEETVPLSRLEVGDRVLLRHGELIPADARVVSGQALLDYHFVTGESEPVELAAGARCYAGGRQMGGLIEVAIERPVSQSRLTELWNDPAFTKPSGPRLEAVTDRVGRWFTAAVVAAACLAAGYHLLHDPAVAVRAFAAVLIVACPCALALSAPFTLGSVLRVLGARGVYLKNAGVIESLARIDSVVFDKTGTLSRPDPEGVAYHGTPLSEEEKTYIFSLARHSTHPYGVRLAEAWKAGRFPEKVRSFLETPGRGMEGQVAGHEIWMGARHWLLSRGAAVPAADQPGAHVYLAIDGVYRGLFTLAHVFRPDVRRLIRRLGERYTLSLLSGDRDRERNLLSKLFGSEAVMGFEQSPADKLAYIRELQASGRRVMMVGDGLNDAGALKQSDVGMAVTEEASAFSPACDILLDAEQVPYLDALLRYARMALHIIGVSFGVSLLYNGIGIYFAARGLLSPLFSAVLMPLSSVSVVSFAVTASAWAGRRCGFDGQRKRRGDPGA